MDLLIVRICDSVSFSLSLSPLCPSSPPLSLSLSNDSRWRTDRLGGLGRGWYRHPLVSLLILSDHLPSTIALATLFYEEPARQLSTDQSLSLSLSTSFSCSHFQVRIPEIRISATSIALSPPLFFFSANTLFFHLIRVENSIIPAWAERGTFSANNRLIECLFPVLFPH